MEINCIHIHALFGQMQPELLLQSILQPWQHAPELPEAAPLHFSAHKPGRESYLHCVRSVPETRRCTESELAQYYCHLEEFLQADPAGGIFALLARYARQTLRFDSSEPTCRQCCILDWRRETLSFGQDLFSCAGLAAGDAANGVERQFFAWPAALQTDSVALQNLLARGCSENHFHLNGSSQIFALAWSDLMNHPNDIRAYFKRHQFAENLMPSTSYGVRDNKLIWPQRLYIAAWLRAKLFLCLDGEPPLKINDFAAFFNGYRQLQDLRGLTESLRVWGARMRQKGRDACLDYAVTPALLNKNDNAFRLLAGERFFLYCWFHRCFQGRASNTEMNLFYLYLLIKLRFREELIQSNARNGLRNFCAYQDRKSAVWGARREYWSESYRLSVAADLSRKSSRDTPYIQSLEARIMPTERRGDLIQEIKEIDLSVWDAMQDPAVPAPDTPYASKQKLLRNIAEASRYHYVLHFAKAPLPRVTAAQRDARLLPARNDEVRRRARVQAKAVIQALKHSRHLCFRIRGIDACSQEIGCRPETFAAAFRYLRNQCTMTAQSRTAQCRPMLHATYHVGEDFLDITDGLRAIDEACLFLELEDGDRLGHAIALGIDASEYYKNKAWTVYLPAQDLLDNFVWLLFRCQAWGISIPLLLRTELKEQARQLLREIYPSLMPSLADHYHAWRLRGDDPELYRCAGTAAGIGALLPNWIHPAFYRSVFAGSALASEGESEELLAMYRSDSTLRQLLYAYHFGMAERERGQHIKAYRITREYVSLIQTVQDAMMRRMMKKGIAVECNPSSNKLIGPFDRYDQHPIFRFNHHGLPLPEFSQSRIGLRVCVNTDDQGIFDTSLENEYALLFGCLQGRVDEHEIPLISEDACLDYLDHLRRMGNALVFPKVLGPF